MEQIFCFFPNHVRGVTDDSCVLTRVRGRVQMMLKWLFIIIIILDPIVFLCSTFVENIKSI